MNEEKKELAAESALDAKKRALLKQESREIIDKMISETNPDETDKLIAQFNLNQKRKTMARAEKIGELLDTITENTIERFTKHPNEITTAEMVNALKVAQDISEKQQKQLNDKQESIPMIQINQQNNDINIENRDSKERVMSAVEKILKTLDLNDKNNTIYIEQDAQESEVDEH